MPEILDESYIPLCINIHGLTRQASKSSSMQADLNRSTPDDLDKKDLLIGKIC